MSIRAGDDLMDRWHYTLFMLNKYKQLATLGRRKTDDPVVTAEELEYWQMQYEDANSDRKALQKLEGF